MNIIVSGYQHGTFALPQSGIYYQSNKAYKRSFYILKIRMMKHFFSDLFGLEQVNNTDGR